MHKRSKALYGLIWTGIGTMLALVVVALYWAFAPYDGVVITGEPVLTSSPQVKEAQAEKVEWTRESVCVDGYATAITRWADLYIEGEFVASLALPAIEFPAPEEGFCASPSYSSIILPVYLPAGDYRIRLITTYQPNPMFDRAVVSYSPWFAIVP